MASKKKGNAPKNEAEELLRLKELERLRIEKENELKAEAVSFLSLGLPSSAHLGLGFMVLRQNSDQNEFDTLRQ